MSRYLDRDLLFFDGAMGTMLQKSGLEPGERSDIMNLRLPDAVAAIHRAYREAGSDILCTNTFGANSRALAPTGHSVREIVEAGVKIAKTAAPGALVALDVGPIGEFMEPYGELTPEHAYSMFREQIEIGAAAGADIVAIETMSDVTELAAAVRAARDACELPIFATMTFDKSGRTYTGASPADFVRALEGLGAAAIGVNCSLLPREVFPVFRELSELTALPLISKPNAGLPGGDGSYAVTPEEFAAQMGAFVDSGAAIIGACCGSDPEFIRELKKAYGGK
ncbi:MAG: homocysteine S-methyltransferase family protein [Oscillospiraceae bacterium]|jgi:5-methyltetrahydrofolate--homocysteine methyltransferase|nr:homocysteine S-methyltransferase family protein [Oscillospiraceae bacterium]